MNSTAPPVVAVVVVHQPGAWFSDTLRSLRAQDHDNLRYLFLITNGGHGDSEGLHEQIRAVLPDAFIRDLGDNPGYGPAANSVLQLVEGDQGFFCFLHDDVALRPTAIRLMVEEIYRSNAGIVGPKLLDWDSPRILQSVGLAVDRFGEQDPLVEVGEVDQQQHDHVREMMALSSACLLVRADLFRTLGGFSEAIDYHGDDVDLCWRARLSGARVVVVPAAVGRHRAELATRRPDLNHRGLAARHRTFTVATLTGGRRTPLVLIQSFLFGIVQFIVGLFTGTSMVALSNTMATLGIIPRLPSVLRRRGQIRPLRLVPDEQVVRFQARGSARVSSYLRSRDTGPVEADASVERRWRQTAGSAPAITWFVLVALVVIGSRQLIANGVPRFGQFVSYPDSPRTMLGDYASGWWAHGLGATTAVPSGVAMVALGSSVTLFNMGLWHTVSVIGMLIVGYLGMWRLGYLFPTARARVAGVLVYALVPLPAGLFSDGRWSALACYAATPWVIHLLRRVAGMETLGSATADVVEEYALVDWRRRTRMFAGLLLAVAVPAAYTPAFVAVAVVIALVLALTTLAAGGDWRASLVLVAAGLGAAVGAFILHLPWSATFRGDGAWTAIIGVPPVDGGGLGLARLARFGIGTTRFGVLGLALYLPLVGALLVARSWRLTWAIRAAGLVVTFLALAVLDDHHALPLRLPEPGVLLAPVAVGLALAAACLAAAFQDDVRAGGFGWRQPLGLAAAVAVVVGSVPGVIAASGGRWNTPKLTLVSVLGQLPVEQQQGDFRILWLGDPRLMPVASWMYRPGLAYALSQNVDVTLSDAWAGPPSESERNLRCPIEAIATETTLRAGRLLAPFGIRFIVIPISHGSAASGSVLPVPSGLVDALDDQLDLAQPLLRPLSFIVYENTAWTPVRSELTAAGQTVSQQAGDAVIADTDLTGSTPFAVGAPLRGPASGAVQPGVVHVASPVDNNWSLRIDATTLKPRSAFGSTMAFDVPAAGQATLRYRTPVLRTVSIVIQAVLWLIVVLAASRFDPQRLLRRRRRTTPVGQPLLTIDDEVGDTFWDGEP